ncbi:MAG: M15 family metallopeptidase [Candidatus Zixiibacteriota bacterium]|nr:MAG: M15 family metallopeptidase [candidate division Zixibacteria bacterium]
MKQVATAAVVVLFLTAATVMAECRETVMIDSTEYTVPSWWCGHKIDSANLAEPSTLRRLPPQLCYEDFRIYVRPDTKAALVKMAERARRDSIDLIAKSGFRSPSYQKTIIKRRLAKGATFEEITRLVAPPGYSEHHTGRAVDLVTSAGSFAESDVYRWLKTHAAEFNFIESFPDDSAGDRHWEPWHWYHAPPE